MSIKNTKILPLKNEIRHQKPLNKALVMLFLFFLVYPFTSYAKNRLEVSYEAYINEASYVYRIRPEFIKAVIQTESNWNYKAKSQKGAIGLMQIMPYHAKSLGFSPKLLWNPRVNILVGTRYLKKLLIRFNGDFIKALAAYNAGVSKVNKYNGVPPYKETRQYVKKVIVSYAKHLHSH